MQTLELDPARTPEAIEARSFAIIDALIPEPRRFTGLAWQLARRCIHTLGDTSILPDLVFSPGALEAGVAAIRDGSRILTDTQMAKVGISQRYGPLSVESVLSSPGLAEKAAELGCTRAKAAFLAHADSLADSLVVIGNAPTALLTLLELLEQGVPSPRLIIGLPVGFVNAAQAKDLLARSPYPHITLLGTKGGSALAAACVNALSAIVAQES